MRTYGDRSESDGSYFIILAMTSEMDAGGMAVEVQPSC
jgi:hypothetical protein